MRVLVACEWSGTVRNSFLSLGHDAYSCDILTGREPTYQRHIRGDVRPLLKEEWDLIIAHPPCTYLCNSGVRWLNEQAGRHQLMEEGCKFLLECYNANSPRVCVENPIMHKYAKTIIGIEQSQIIQPYQFGHPVTKATCLWLRRLPVLKPTKLVAERQQSIANIPPINVKGLRGHIRSVTFEGIAKAMAQQWCVETHIWN